MCNYWTTHCSTSQPEAKCFLSFDTPFFPQYVSVLRAKTVVKNSLNSLVIHLIKSFRPLTVDLVRWGEEEEERKEAFQVMPSRLLSASLWGGTPDSEGEPCCSPSTLLHFLSVKLLILEGAWESILTLGGRAVSCPFETKKCFGFFLLSFFLSFLLSSLLNHTNVKVYL